jgi:hypothetical protein
LYKAACRYEFAICIVTDNYWRRSTRGLMSLVGLRLFVSCEAYQWNPQPWG